MGRKAAGLTAAKAKTAGPGRYGDGDGLYLFVRTKESAFWVFRYVKAGKMREMGLGRARGNNAVSLAEARDKAGDLFRRVRAGADPLADRAAAATVKKAEAQTRAILAITFREAADGYIATHEDTWANAKHRTQWTSSLDKYVHPHFGDVPVGDVTTAHVLSALEPIWKVKPETAARVRGRIESVLAAATARGQRTGPNPASWKGHLAELLPSRASLATVEHHAALPWKEIAAFMVKLGAQNGIGARALDFCILTAARTSEVLGARWCEVNLADRVWTIPGHRMKAGREHKVPLAAPVIALLLKVAGPDGGADPLAYLFPGARPSRALSNMAMTMTLRRMARADLTVHGFRSTFRDWTSDQTTIQREVAEAALAHTIGDKVEAAYRRGDLFDKRAKLMEAWAAFCAKDRPDLVPPKLRNHVGRRQNG